MNPQITHTATTMANHLFNWWSVSLWAIVFVLIIMFFTGAWKYVWHVSILMAIGGWMCLIYAGFTGDSFMGWFAWAIFLSMALFIRAFLEHLNRIADKQT